MNSDTIIINYNNKAIKVTPLEYGKSVLPESMVFKNGSKEKTKPIVFMIYLIEVDDKKILADGGCDTMPGFDMKDFIGPVKALAKVNLTPDDITDVIITHSHHDHIEGAKHFKNADVYIQKDEYKDGESYLKDNNKIILFKDSIEVYPNVKVINIGGHSVGSCIIEMKDENKTYIISGDECYSRECLDKQIITGCSCNHEKSEAFIKRYSTDEYQVLLCHEK